MRSADVGRLMLLGAIWGGSFIFMRLAAPSMGAILTAELRVGISALVLLVIVAGKRVPLHSGRLWRHYLALGALQSAVPFALYCWAETRIDASTAAILNSTSPLFGMVTAALMLGDRLSAPRVLGMAIAFAGVAGVVGGGMTGLGFQDLLPVLACLGATLCYGLAATYTKARSTDAAPLANAFGSQAASTVMLLPLLPFAMPSHSPSNSAWMAVIALGSLCTGIAYVLYFRLIADVGPARALTVTFISPVFGMVWSFLFLGEAITLIQLVASAAILLGTALATGILAPKSRSAPAGP